MGYETPVEMPSMGIYNTDLMKMYIAGVKDQYEKGQEEMKDFMKLYGDFYSPIAGDTQRYNDMTVGGARDMINQMLANGIDPYKSPEARAAISRYINSVPTGILNAMKQNAENRKIYDQAKAKSMADGKWNPAYEQWALEKAGLNNFSTIGPNGEIRTWDRLAPASYEDLHSFTDDWFKHVEPKFDEEMTKQKNDGFRYYTVTDKDLRDIVNQRVPDIINDGGLGQFYYEQALNAAGGDKEKAMNLFEDRVVDRNKDYIRVKDEVDPYKQAEYSARVHARYSNSGGGGGSGSNTKGTTSWFDTWYKAYHMNMRGSSLTLLDGQRAYVSKLFNKNANGGLRMTTIKANSLLKKSGSQMDPVIIAKLLGKKLNDDGTITLSSADLHNIKFSTETASKIAYVPKTGYTASRAFENSEARSKIKNAINNKEPFRIHANNISMIVQEDGSAQIVIPGTTVYGNAGNTVQNTVLETDLRGNIDASGNFVPDNNTAARLMVADQIGTDVYANQSNYTKKLE